MQTGGWRTGVCLFVNMFLNASESADGFVNGFAGAGLVAGGCVGLVAGGVVNPVGTGGALCLITILAGILIWGGKAGAGAGAFWWVCTLRNS